MIDHVGRVKFGHFDTHKDEAALQLRGIIESIFQKANYKDDVPAAVAGHEPKSISKVREYIKDFSKKQQELSRTEDIKNGRAGSHNSSLEEKNTTVEKESEIVDIWRDVMQQKNQL